MCEIVPTIVGPRHDGSRSCFDDAPARSKTIESTDVSGDNVATWEALGDLGRALCREPDFADLHRVLLNPPRAATRVRDIFLCLLSLVMSLLQSLATSVNQ